MENHEGTTILENTNDTGPLTNTTEENTTEENDCSTTTQSDQSTEICKAEKDDKNIMNFATTNARSLAQKCNSAVEYFDELDLSFMVITETWLREGRSLSDNVADLEPGAALSLIHKGRTTGRGGGVGILYKPSRISLKRYQLPKKQI